MTIATSPAPRRRLQLLIAALPLLAAPFGLALLDGLAPRPVQAQKTKPIQAPKPSKTGAGKSNGNIAASSTTTLSTTSTSPVSSTSGEFTFP